MCNATSVYPRHQLTVPVDDVVGGLLGADVANVLREEYRMVLRIVARHDFAEGVRAVLVDRSKDPKWQPAALGKRDFPQKESLRKERKKNECMRMPSLIPP